MTIKFVPVQDGDLVFAALMAFGIATCGIGLWRALRDPDPYSGKVAFAPALGAFMLFPLINALIGVILVICWAREWWRVRP